jgi:CubicO group peptidase (beta-lactamase class C family)
MRRPVHLRFILDLCVILLLIAGLLSAQGPVFPGKEWERAGDARAAGYSPQRLEVLRSYLATLDTTAMMVVSGGRVVFEYGELSRLSYLASARKSVLAMLYGNYVASGKIHLDRTLRDLEFDDIEGLLPGEREATVEHLITARSGIYHPASNPGDSTALAPPRGSQKPGAYFLYNNWDFNAAGAVFERMTGKDIYDALESDLAQPIGMQDYERERQKKSGDPKRSQHLAYHMWLSTRDMARLGYLMLREGDWAGRQVAPRDWTRKIVSLVTPLAQLNPLVQREASYGGGTLWGYGCMWWVWDSPGENGPFSGAYTAMGAYGQYITVLPKRDLVIVHKTDPGQPRAGEQPATPRPRSVNLSEYSAAVNLLLVSALPRQ